jgi:carboxymethylenebutenolidase
MDSFVVHPEEGGPVPAVLVLMDIWGCARNCSTSRAVATVGYHVTVPNFWYRRGKVRFEYRDDKGRMRSLCACRRSAGRAARQQAATDGHGDGRHRRGAEISRRRAGAARTEGRHRLLPRRLAVARGGAEFPDQFRARASMHGTRLVSDKPDSPHRFVDKMRGEIYCGFAEKDDLAPPSTIETLGKLFAGCDRVKYRGLVHPGTEHGYALPDRDIFNKPAANRDWENIFAMFRRQLG